MPAISRLIQLPPFARNVLRVLGGTIIAQLLVLAATPFLSRIYTPEAFALSQSFTSIIGTLMMVACLRYELALTVSSREETPSLLLLCGAITCLMATALFFFSPLLSHRSATLFNTTALSRLGFISAIGLVASTALNATTFLLIKEKLFTQLAAAKIVQAVAFVAMALALAFVAKSVTGVLLADVTSRSIAFLTALAFCIPVIRGLGGARVLSRIPGIMRKYRNFPLISVPAGLLNSLGGAFNTVWMLALFDASTAGSYAIVERIISAPVGLVAGAISQVYQAEILSARTSDPALARERFRRLVMMQVKIGAIPFALLFFLSPYALPLLLGPQWRQAGVFCQILAPFQFIVFVTFPFQMVLTVMERQHLQLAWDAIRFALVSGCWFAAKALRATPVEAIAATAVAGGVSYLIFLAMAYRSIGQGRGAGA